MFHHKNIRASRLNFLQPLIILPIHYRTIYLIHGNLSILFLSGNINLCLYSVVDGSMSAIRKGRFKIRVSICGLTTKFLYAGLTGGVYRYCISDLPGTFRLIPASVACLRQFAVCEWTDSTVPKELGARMDIWVPLRLASCVLKTEKVTCSLRLSSSEWRLGSGVPGCCLRNVVVGSLRGVNSDGESTRCIIWFWGVGVGGGGKVYLVLVWK